MTTMIDALKATAKNEAAEIKAIKTADGDVDDVEIFNKLIKKSEEAAQAAI